MRGKKLLFILEQLYLDLENSAIILLIVTEHIPNYFHIFKYIFEKKAITNHI